MDRKKIITKEEALNTILAVRLYLMEESIDDIEAFNLLKEMMEVSKYIVVKGDK